MQRKKRHFFKHTLLTALFSCFMLSIAQAAKPVWTFTPQTPTTITVAKGASAQVIYTVQNQSALPKVLIMKPMAGVSQGAPCQLPPHGSCVLTLNINGSTLPGDVVGGPILCQQGNDLQCYQPSLADILRVHLVKPPVQKFTCTPMAGPNGTISPSTTQVVNQGTSLVFTATPNPSFGVHQWLLDGNVVQTGGTTYQLANIQDNHLVEVTFNQTTLSPLTQSMALSINSPKSDPPLNGKLRDISIQNTGSVTAMNVQVSATKFPKGTAIISNTCTGNLDPDVICDIVIKPGDNASLDVNGNACTTAPGTEPVPSVITVSADNAPETNVNVFVLGYGCIYQGGFLFAVDNSTPGDSSIGGKVAALTDESNNGDKWATVLDNTAADSITNGLANSNALATPAGQYPAAQACLNKSDQGFTDWYLPAICELGRFMGQGEDAGCGQTNPNVLTALYIPGLGNLSANTVYWSSTEFHGSPKMDAWVEVFSLKEQAIDFKINKQQVRCIRAFTP